MNQIDFQVEYNRKNCLNFLKSSFLPEDFCEDYENIDHLGNVDSINSVTFLGKSPSLDLNVYEIEHLSEQDPRVTLTKSIFRLMKLYVSRRSLVFLVSKNSPNYRFSLVTLDFSIEDKKLKKEFSNPRRYSFLLGPGAKIHTPEQFIVKKGRVKDFDDLQSRFSIEIVNNEFYSEIAWLFTKLVGGTRGKGRQEETFKGSLVLPSTSDHQTKQEYAVKLIGRLVFCWFLKKKCSENGLALLPEELLSTKAVEKNKQFYHQVLEPLFFEVLNTPIESRDKKYSGSPWNQIPFLNGGLFSPRYHDFYELGSVGVSNYLNTLKIPDDWINELFKVFETFNFTIDENTTVDVELSIEPEMLGRIFENLLAEINPETGETARKSTGSYYTPRPIVNFMVDESLKQYLLTKTKIAQDKLMSLLSYDDSEINLNENEKDSILDALDTIKIIDPACGSGAFPMGILHKMLLILQKIDPDSNVWLDKQVSKIENLELRTHTKKKLMNENVNYIHKLGIIHNAIYGIDIQPIAVEISKLRFFLSLIVDEKVDDSKENRGVEPLPNLEFKFVCANTLLPLPQNKGGLGESLKLIKQLEKLRAEYFSSFGKSKKRIEIDFEVIQDEMKGFLTVSGFLGSQSAALSSWRPFSDKPSDWFDPEWMFGLKDGFDIVIGNPPYVRQENIDQNIKYIYIQNHPDVGSGTADLYIYFINSALNISKLGGVIIFITLNKYLKTKYGEGLRNKLKDKNVDLIIDFFELPVFEASTDSSITKIINSPDTDSTRYFPVKSLNNLDLNILTKGESLKVIKDGTGWKFVKPGSNSIIEKLYSNTVSLQKFTNDKIYRGITTGYNDAFVLNKESGEVLLNSKSYKLIRRYAIPSAIRKWCIEEQKYFLATGFDLNIEKDYPDAFNFLKKHKEKLIVRQDQGKNWWNLRSCTYYDLFDKPKIIYIRTSKNHAFYLDEQGIFINDSCYLISSDNKFLFFFLNSILFDWLKRIKFVAYGDADEGGRVKLDYNKMITVPIKNISDNQLKWFEKQYAAIKTILHNEVNVKALENEVETMLFRIYNLTYKEVKTVCHEFWLSEGEYERFQRKEASGLRSQI